MRSWGIHVIYLIVIAFVAYLAVSTNRALHDMTQRYAAVLVKQEKQKQAAKKSPELSQADLKLPNMDQFAIQSWANAVAVRAYSFDFLNYKKQFSELSQYYVPEAWTKFRDALDKSNILTTVLAEKMVVSAVAQGSVTITKQGLEGDRYVWHVLLPLKVTMANTEKKLGQLATVNLTIVRVKPPLGKQGVAVQQFDVTLLPK